MANEPIDPAVIVRVAFEAFIGGDITTLREYVAPDLEWTYLDPSQENPEPATCYGREQLEEAIAMWSTLGLRTDLEELAVQDDKVMVILYAPGLDAFRARKADDRNFHVATVAGGRVRAISACQDRDEARKYAGLD